MKPFHFSFLFILCCLWCSSSRAQHGFLHTDNDSNYVSLHDNDLTIRLYGSRKYTSYSLHDRNFGEKVVYKPNSPFNIGFGFNYRLVGLNIGLNFPFINKEGDHGKTNYLDLQYHLYLRKIVVDFYGQLYNGYYLSNATVLNYENQDRPYIRPDIHTREAGLSAQYIFNDKKFSFRAAYLQNEYQKKSAGSLMLGFDLHAMFIRGDSSIIPQNIKYQNFFGDNTFDRAHTYCGTLNLGYAYTLVVDRHFFVTLALHAGAGINSTTLKEHHPYSKMEQLGLEYNGTLRFAIGYNSEKYFAGIHYVGLWMYSSAPVADALQEYTGGNFRVSIARRFTMKKKLFGFY